MVYYEPAIDIMDYIVALYDNVSVEEKRAKLFPKINDIFVCMDVLGNIIDVLKRKIMESKVFPVEAYEVLETEYRELNLDRYLEFKYIADIAKLGFFRLNGVGFYAGTLPELINSTLENADELTDELIKTDIYCIIIRILVSFNATLDYIETARKVMDYYNALPDDEREITILPNSLAIF